MNATSLPNYVNICNAATSKIRFRTPTARHTASKPRLYAFKTTFYDLWMFICVSVDGHSSCRTRLRHEVPQGPFLSMVHCAGLSDVFAKHGVRCHVCADDTQLYVDFPPNYPASAADRISRCVRHVKVWLASRCLLLNEAKAEAILFTTQTHLASQPRLLPIEICGRNVITSANMRDLGVHLDSTFAHVNRICRTAYAKLRCIAQIRSVLTFRACKTPEDALVTS